MNPVDPRKIVVIAAEDDPLFQRMLQNAFNPEKNPEAERFQLYVVGNGKEAEAAMTRESFETIDGELQDPIFTAKKIICLMDRNMPIMGGDDATKAIKGHDRRNSLPAGGSELSFRIIIAYSTDVTDLVDNPQAQSEIGYDVVLKKPMATKALFTTLNEVITLWARKASCPPA